MWMYRLWHCLLQRRLQAATMTTPGLVVPQLDLVGLLVEQEL
jgi:hypothetical protein